MTHPLPAFSTAESGQIPANSRLIHKSDLEDLLTSWHFNPLDHQCVLDLAPAAIIDGQTYFKLPALERLLARAYWIGTDTRLPDAA